MSGQVESIRSQVAGLCKEILTNALADDLRALLSQGDYILEVSFEQGHGVGAIPVTFAFDNQVLETRREVTVLRNARPSMKTRSRRERARDLAAVGKRLLSLSSLKFFDPLFSLLRSAMESAVESALWADPRGEGAQASEVWYVEFRVEGICLLEIYSHAFASGDVWVGVDHYLEDEKEVFGELPEDGDLLLFPKQGWFADLGSDAKKSVLEASKLLQAAQEGAEGLRVADWSPMFLPFFRAIESEIVLHYRSHSDDIRAISRTLNRALGQRNEKSRVEFPFQPDGDGIGDLVKSILKYKRNWTPSGINPLYCFLKYFALKSGIESWGFDSYLLPRTRSVLREQHPSLDWLKRLHRFRNEFVHRRAMDDEAESLLVYDWIGRCLRLLVLIKKSEAAASETTNSAETGDGTG